MNLVEQLRTWDEIPDDDSDAFHWLDLKTAEAARMTLSKDDSLNISNYVLDKMLDAIDTTPDQALEQFAAKVREQTAQQFEKRPTSRFFGIGVANEIRAIKELPK